MTFGRGGDARPTTITSGPLEGHHSTSVLPPMRDRGSQDHVSPVTLGHMSPALHFSPNRFE